MYAITAPSIMLTNAPTKATRMLFNMDRQIVQKATEKFSVIASHEMAKEKIFSCTAGCGFRLFRMVTYSGIRLKIRDSVTQTTEKI